MVLMLSSWRPQMLNKLRVHCNPTGVATKEALETRERKERIRVERIERDRLCGRIWRRLVKFNGTQKELCEKLSISRNAMTDIMSMRRPPSLSILQSLEAKCDDIGLK